MRTGVPPERFKGMGKQPLRPTGRRSAGGALGLLLVTLALPATAGALPPVAEFTYMPAVPRIGEEVSFTSQSTDPDEDLSTQAWDLDDDGQFDDGTGFAVTAGFLTSGPHTVSLRATDLAGEVATVSHVVNVNFPPEAAIAFTPALPKVGDTVTFRSASTDRDGKIVRTRWDLDDDGAFDDGTGSTAKQRFATEGLHTVRLLVRDDIGEEAIAAADVSVSTLVVASGPGPTDDVVPTPAPPVTALAFGNGGAPATVPAPIPVAVRRPALLLSPFPIVRIRGTFLAGWIRLQILSVRAPQGARIALRCSGITCPVRAVVRVQRTGGAPVRFRMMERRRLRAGVVISIAITKQDRIGKYTRFVLRRSAAPARRDTCIRYGATRPSACPVQ
jgi:PKD repeat protein